MPPLSGSRVSDTSASSPRTNQISPADGRYSLPPICNRFCPDTMTNKAQLWLKLWISVGNAPVPPPRIRDRVMPESKRLMHISRCKPGCFACAMSALSEQPSNAQPDLSERT